MQDNVIEAYSKPDHGYHLVDPSPWPILSAFSLLILAIGAILFMHKQMIGHIILPAGFIAVFTCMYCWWRDVVREGVNDNAHTEIVRHGLRMGMGLFIISEVMFFYAFFFSYFKASLSPVGILDGVWASKPGIWPPENIELFDPWDTPLINTLILLLSGTTVTWAHHALVNYDKKDVVKALKITIVLGLFFSSLQALEYFEAPFKFTDGVYASNFYMATGFHGAHVIIGTIFLIVCLFRAKKGDFEQDRGHLGFEFAAWYWHFVDVVWLFLFIFVYVF